MYWIYSVQLLVICCLLFIECAEFNHLKSQHAKTILQNAGRNRRYIFMNASKMDKNYQACNTTSNLEGHCKYIEFCKVDKQTKDKFTENGENSCQITEKVVGICCPDYGESYKSRGSNIVYNLPSTGDEEFHTVIERPSSITEKRPNRCGLPTEKEPVKNKKTVPKPVDWPWMAAVIRGGYKPIDPDYPEPLEPTCGAVLITDKHVLTAAHCFVGYNNSDILIRLGEYDSYDQDETRHRDFPTERILIHPQYNSDTHENDMALITLRQPTNFNTYIWPICLPPAGQSFENVTAYVTGWGAESFGGPMNYRLTEILIPVWTQDACRNAFSTVTIPDSVICAAGTKGEDSCQNDSGGPLMHQLSNGRWVNIGIVSWGVGCGSTKTPGIYTRVNHYLPWIWDNTIE